jgi:type II secretory pathway component PulF
VNQNPSTPLPHLLAAGLPLAEGLRAIAEDAVPWRERAGLRRLARRLERGEAIDEALARERRLPAEVRVLVREGIASGRLGLVLEEYVRTSRESRSIWRQFSLSLLYPSVMIWLSAGIFLLFLWFAVPIFREIYDDFGVVPFPAGNTGAQMAASTLILKLHDGLTRPAIGTVFPTVNQSCIQSCSSQR